MSAGNASKALGCTALISFCCCLVCCAIPGVIGIAVLSNVFDWPEVEAVVTGLWLCPDSSEDNDLYKISFNFTTWEGDVVSGTTDYCASFVPGVGDTETIYYDPSNPEVVVQESLIDIAYIASKVAAGIGWSFVIISVFAAVFFFTRANKRNQNSMGSMAIASAQYETTASSPADEEFVTTSFGNSNPKPSSTIPIATPIVTNTSQNNGSASPSPSAPVNATVVGISDQMMADLEKPL